MTMRLLLGILFVAGVVFAPFRDDAMIYYIENAPAATIQTVEQR